MLDVIRVEHEDGAREVHLVDEGRTYMYTIRQARVLGEAILAAASSARFKVIQPAPTTGGAGEDGGRCP
jgi:hypothetical protein